MRLRHGSAFRELMKEDGDEHTSRARRRENALCDGHAIKKCATAAQSPRCPPPIDGVGFLAEVKVRRQGVLREMHAGSPPHQRRLRRARARERFGRTSTNARQHEAAEGTKCSISASSRAARRVTGAPDDVAERGDQGRSRRR